MKPRTANHPARRSSREPAKSDTVRRPPRRLAYLLMLLGVLAAALLLTLLVRSRQPGMPVEQLLQAAVSAAEKGESQVSVEYLDEALRIAPEHPEALLYRGQIAYEQGRAEEARQFLQRVPDSPAETAGMARYIEGVLLVGQGFAREGEQLLRKAASLNASFLPPHERLVELYAAEIRTADVRRELEQVRRFRPWRLEELVLYTTANQSPLTAEEGQSQMRQFLAAVPGSLDHQLLLARYQLKGDQYGEAEATLKKVLDQRPGLPSAVGLLAELYMLQSRFDDAAGTLGRVQADTEPDFWFYRSCGQYWLKQGQWDWAVRCLAAAAEREPEDLTVAHQLGIALSRQQQEATAAEQLQRAERIDHVVRQASRIAKRDSQQPGPLLKIMVDVGETLALLERYREAAFWFDHALLVDSNAQPAREGLQLVTGRLRELEQPEAARAPANAPDRTEPHWGAIVERIRNEAERLKPTGPVAAMAAGSSRIRLNDVHELAGIDFQYFNGDTGSKYLLESMGGGVAVLDYDQDGWPDLYLVQGCELPYDATNKTYQNRLYRNLGDGRFQDVTAEAGVGDNHYGQGCAAADYDNDGDTDLFVANWGPNVLYRNNGDGTFVEVTMAAGLEGEQWSSSVGFADFDKDGALDLYVTSYVDYADSLRVCRGADGRVAACDPSNFVADQDRLYRNLGDGTFEDVTQSSGIVAANGKGLGLMLADLDNDSWTDIYVANDGTPNFLFRNESRPGQIAFREVGVLSGVAVNGQGQAEGGMGIACADFQHDGRLDLYVTNFAGETNTLYANLGDLLFEDATRAMQSADSTEPLVGFGVQPVDFDLDGFDDLIVANGHIDDFRFRDEPWKMRPQLFRNLGGGRFEELSGEVSPYLRGEYLGRGAARLDWDRDGDLDVVIVHQDAPLALLSNETPRASNSWLGLQLHGVTSPRDATGTRIELHTGSGIRQLELTAGDGFYSSNERRQIVGLGSSSKIDQVVVRWPSGQVSVMDQPEVNQMHVVVEDDGETAADEMPIKSP